MRLAARGQMTEIERYTIEQIGLPSCVLMENAAFCVVRECIKLISDKRYAEIIVVCGDGNNGGDGFAAARQLFLKNIPVKVVFIGCEERLKGDALRNYNILHKLGVPVSFDFSKLNCNNGIIIDALFGIGINSDLKGIYAETVDKINDSGCYVISIDVPSGINPDNGFIYGKAVRANKTVTFGFAKPGHFLFPATEYCGEIIVCDIGIPELAAEQCDITYEYLEDKEAEKLLPVRLKRSNKGTYGTLNVFAGCDDMPGAAYLCAYAAYKTGVGLVKPYTTKQAANVLRNGLKEAVVTSFCDENGFLCGDSLLNHEKGINNGSAAVVGCGLGCNDIAARFVEKLLSVMELPAVIDADALNVISKNKDILKKYKKPVVITPHPGEMVRLTGISIEDILSDTVKTAVNFAKEYNIVVCLKDARTIVANPSGKVYINVSGSNALAKAGTGDVLAGIIGGLMSFGLSAYDSARLGAYLHGRAGERAEEKFGQRGVMATDVISFL